MNPNRGPLGCPDCLHVAEDVPGLVQHFDAKHGTRTGVSVEVAALPDCDLCRMGIVPRSKPAVVDGKTRSGPWANMCEQHFDQYGVGLGTGRGQRLVLRGSPAESTTGPTPVLPAPGAVCTAQHPSSAWEDIPHTTDVCKGQP